MQNKDGFMGNDLETAFGALTLFNLGYRGEPLERASKCSLAATNPTAIGGWALAPAIVTPVAPLNYGSRSVTTAVCIEVLAKYSTKE